MFGDADLSIFFADMGVPAVFGGVTVKVLLDRPAAWAGGEQGIGGVGNQKAEMRCAFNAWATMPVNGNSIAVNGTPFLIAGPPTAESDGRILCFYLKAAS